MDTRSENDGSQSIDELHAEAIAATAEATGTDPAVETHSDPGNAPTPGVGPNTAFCEKVIATVCRWHAKAVHDEFFTDLEKICGENQAERIASKAAMDPEMQALVAAHGAKALEKYGLAKFVSDEAMVIGALAMYFTELRASRRDRDKILAEHNKG